ncbi:MAG: type III pantothenate kinase [Bacteroidales bacterium]|nr:type III pantothenate kinase [Bacteroidales bacterium]
MKLCVDIGNTFVKAAVFEKADQIDDVRFRPDNFELFATFIKKHEPLQSAIISTVRGVPAELIHLLGIVPKVILLEHTTPLPIVINYDTPETLGRDRIAAVAAAYARFPQQNVLVIDMGTCITYDLLTSDGVYQGGMISPGVYMRFKAMNEFTNRLPLVEPELNVSLIGKSTSGSLQSGVMHGIRSEINGIIGSFSINYKDLTVLIGGGDNKYFDQKFNCSIFAASNLVLEGLNVILDFNDLQ